MKKFKLVIDWFFRVGLSVILVIFVVVAPISLFPSLLNDEAQVNRAQNLEHQGILELWHVETFEGGSVSRSSFLEREAIIFEREHKGTFISIQTMSLEQFKLNINNGKKPNILSFGVGVENSFISDLLEIDAGDTRSDLKVYGKIGNRQYAVPYILGGYALIYQNSLLKTNEDLTGVGLKGATNPLNALNHLNKQIEKIYDDKTLDSYDAYDKFLKGNFGTLLGTQRDVYRVYNRQSKGLLNECSYEFLEGYTDLVQYISVFESEDAEQNLSLKFVARLLSEDVQKKLANYNLFSTLNNLNLYDSGIYKDFEKTLSKSITSINAFSTLDEINLQKEEAYLKVVANK